MSNRRPAETDVAACMVAWLHEWRWDVWQEVTFRGGSERADIVAVRDGLLLVVEAKSSLTFDVIAQARDWTAHYRAVVVPHARKSRGRSLAHFLCRDLGIGLYETEGKTVQEVVPPRLVRWPRRDQTVKRMIAQLDSFPRDFAPAGTATGKGWSPYTPYQNTMRRIRAFLKEKPGSDIKDILSYVAHHYASPASARGAIPKWLQSVEKDWCRVEWDGKQMRFYVRDDAKPLPTLR